MPAGGVELDAVDRQHAAAIGRRVGRSRAVAVIGEDDELQAGAGGRGGDLRRRCRCRPSDRSECETRRARSLGGGAAVRMLADGKKISSAATTTPAPIAASVSGSLASVARVKLVVDGAQPRIEDVRVDLRRRQIAVAEHHLDRAQVGAALEQVRGERMPQHVRAERARHTGPLAVLLQDLPEADARQAAPPRALTNSLGDARRFSSAGRASLR